MDGLAEGLSIEEVIDPYPQLARADVLAALGHEGLGKAAGGSLKP